MNTTLLIAAAAILAVWGLSGSGYPYTDPSGFKFRFKRKQVSTVQPQCFTFPCPPLTTTMDIYERQDQPGWEYVLKLGTTLDSPIFVRIGT